jgi:hypothetical protein
MTEALLTISSNDFAVNCFDNQHYVLMIINIFVKIYSIDSIEFIDEFCFFDGSEIGF